MRPSLPVNLFSKVFIIGDQDSAFCKCFLNDLIITHSTRLLIHGKNLVVLLSQPLCHCRAGTFVYQEPHQASAINGTKSVFCKD